MVPHTTLKSAARCPARIAPLAERAPIRFPTRVEAATPSDNLSETLK